MSPSECLEILEDASNELPVPFRHLIDRLTKHLKELDRQMQEFEREIIAWHRNSELSRKLEKIPGDRPSGCERTGRIDRQMRTALTMAGKSRRDLAGAWFHAKAPAAASQRCWG